MSSPLSDDLLIGASAIAAYTGFTVRQIYGLADRQQIPVKKLGKVITGRKSELERHLSTAS